MSKSNQEAIREILASLICSDLYFALDPAARLKLIHYHLNSQQKCSQREEAKYH